MKIKLGKILAVIAFLLMTASSTILRAEVYENTYSAKVSGNRAGVSLKDLYKQYKKDGKIDLDNVDNVLNLTSLAHLSQDLKGKADNSTYFNEFTEGLLRGGKKLINDSNAQGITKRLRDLSGIDRNVLSDAAAAALRNGYEHMYDSSPDKAKEKVAQALSPLKSDKNTKAIVQVVTSIFDMLDK